MVDLARGCFRFLFSSYNSCALFLSLNMGRIAGTTSLSSERPPDGTASVANSFGYLPESRNVSTVLLNPPRTSLSHSFALYRATAAGLREPPWSPAIRAAEVGRKG